MTALVIILALVVALLSVLVAGLLRSNADVLRALHELGVSLDPDTAGHDHSRAASSSDPVSGQTQPGVATPRTAGDDDGPANLTGRTPTGGLAKISVVDNQSLTLIAFLSSGCLTCAGFWEAFGDDDIGHALGSGLSQSDIVIVTKGPESESESSVRTLAPSGVRTIMSSDAWLDYNVPVSPYFILVDGTAGRIVGEGAGATWDQVANLLRQALADAGLNTRAKATRAARASGDAREANVDHELRQAGIEPGDPSLYPAGGQGETQ